MGTAYHVPLFELSWSLELKSQAAGGVALTSVNRPVRPIFMMLKIRLDFFL